MCIIDSCKSLEPQPEENEASLQQDWIRLVRVNVSVVPSVVERSPHAMCIYNIYSYGLCGLEASRIYCKRLIYTVFDV